MKALKIWLQEKTYWWPWRLTPCVFRDWFQTTDYQLQCLEDENARLRERVDDLEKAIDWLTEREMVGR